MASRFASPVRKPAFAPEPMSPRKHVGRAKDWDSEFGKLRTPAAKLRLQEQCFSECTTACPSGSTTFDLASPMPFGAASVGFGNGEASAGLESLQELSAMSMQDYLSFFMPASSASSTPWQPSSAVPGALPDLCPGTPPVRVSAPGPLDIPARVPKNRAAAKPDLMQALTSQSLQAVEQVLADDPDAVNEPFWEQQCEPPLCRAIREGCSPAIIAELLRRGADVNAVDVRACSPYMLLQRAKARLQTMAGPRVAQYELDVVEGLLLEAGAKTAESNAYVQEDTWGMQEDAWDAAPLPFDAPLGTFLPPPMPWNHACVPPMASQY